MKIKYRSNLVAGIVSICLGVICFLIIPMQIGEDYTATYGITSKTVPYAVAALWIVCGIILIIQSLLLKKDEIKILEAGKELKAIGYMLMLLIYGILFKKSFLISTMFLGCVTLAFTGSGKKVYYAVVLAVVAVLYFLFSRVLHIQLP